MKVNNQKGLEKIINSSVLVSVTVAMASPTAPVIAVRLPCFAEYTQFALWPSDQLVSKEHSKAF